MKTTIGGDRLGSGNKQIVSDRTYERSSHDLSYLWRSTMASGTLVPFMSEVALPGDSFDIDLNCDVLTHPTIGPLFGRYKIQLDVFQVPIRLYHKKLYMNTLNIGLNMSQIKLPNLKLTAKGNDIIGDNDQINSSALLSYLNIRGLGRGTDEVTRYFNAIPMLGYWEIYKQYYANKSEEIGVYIHNTISETVTLLSAELFQGSTGNNILATNFTFTPNGTETMTITFNNWDSQKGYPLWRDIQVIENSLSRTLGEIALSDIIWYETGTTLSGNINQLNYIVGDPPMTLLMSDDPVNTENTLPENQTPILKTFPLEDIDKMREKILMADSTTPFTINGETETLLPYADINDKGTDYNSYAKLKTQDLLAIKTYQSDLFNNWINTEWIDGNNGINEISSVDTTAGYFTIDALNLSKKVYLMLNRIAVSGGTYDDWLNATYDHERITGITNPMYLGGLIRELAFQEVVSNANATDGNITQPLGTLAGRGVLTDKRKGGSIKVRIDEPSYLIGIASITPRIDYSQGNKWDVNLETLDDLHKPQLDEIGYQDLITDAIHWGDTQIDSTTGVKTFKSAGKQPAWLNYMTNVNQVRGNFADKDQQMYMTLNRRYELGPQNTDGIIDLTTYIDPSKFNHIFADTRLDAQNFWMQISVDIMARRKMSAKQIPNL